MKFSIYLNRHIYVMHCVCVLCTLQFYATVKYMYIRNLSQQNHDTNFHQIKRVKKEYLISSHIVLIKTEIFVSN